MAEHYPFTISILPVEFLCLNINRKYDAFLVIFSPKDKLPSSNDHIAHDACEIVILFGTVNYSRGGGGEAGTILR